MSDSIFLGSRADFNPRSPHGERRQRNGIKKLIWKISIHALLTESDRELLRMAYAEADFNPRSPHGERRKRRGTNPLPLPISIHALLTESDRHPHGNRLRCHAHFNPRSPHGERPAGQVLTKTADDFNPRSPHGERHAEFRRSLFVRDFNPRSPHGERRIFGLRSTATLGISIHALLTESDQGALELVQPIVISIHALLTESDGISDGSDPVRHIFQSTLSSRRATANTTKLALSFLSKVPILGWEKSKKAKGSANARGSFPVYGKNKVRIPWGDFECFRFAPIK